MFRKLVKLDQSNGWRFMEVDQIKLQRSATDLIHFIEDKIPIDSDRYEIRSQVLPLCEGALNRTLNFPIKTSALPLGYLEREGLLPPGMAHLWAVFCNTATGSHLEDPELVVINGEKYAYTDFEESGDWPDVIQRRTEERRQHAMRDWTPEERAKANDLRDQRLRE